MKKILFAYLLMLLVVCTYAQTTATDSLNAAFKNAKQDTSRVSLLLQMSRELLEKDIEQSQKYADNALTISKRTSSLFWVAKSHRVLADIDKEKKKYLSAIAFMDSSANTFKKIGLLNEHYESIYASGKIYYLTSKFKKAIDAFSIVLEHEKAISNIDGIINGYVWLSICSEEIGDLKSSIIHGEYAYRISIENNQIDKAAMAIMNLGVTYKELGMLDESIVSCDQGIELSKKLADKKYEAAFLENKGVAYTNKGMYVNALQEYYKAMALYEDLDDLQNLAELNFNIGLVYKKNKEYAKAITFYLSALEAETNTRDTAAMANCHHNIGNAYMEMGQIKKAKANLLLSFSLANKVGRDCFRGESGALGNLYYRMNQLDSAKKYMLLELESVKKCGRKKVYAPLMHSLGNVYLKLAERSKAHAYYLNSYESAKESGFLETIKNASESLYQWHKKAGNKSKALEYLEVFQQTSDSLFNQENTRKLAWLDANYQMEKVTDSLNWQKDEEARIYVGEIDAQKQQLYRVLIVASSIILLLVLYYLYMRKKRQLMHQKALVDEQSKGFKAVINATEEERKRIAKDLHDGIGQQLGALKLGLSHLESQVTPEKPQTKADFDSLKQLVNETSEDARSISHQMMPKTLTELGLMPAIKDSLEKSFGKSETKYEFEHFNLKERYNESVEIALYRILQELVNNIIKHSGADEVAVQLFQNRDDLILIVEDNGTGIDKVNAKSGLGMTNIKSRVNTLNGKVDYSPSPESGTVATIKVPVA